MSGQVMNAVQSMVVPSWAPAIEYVAIPDGSSSAAPVMRPGPRTDTSRRISEGFRARGPMLDISITLTKARGEVTLSLLQIAKAFEAWILDAWLKQNSAKK
jgi:hypothetical protein